VVQTFDTSIYPYLCLDCSAQIFDLVFRNDYLQYRKAKPWTALDFSKQQLHDTYEKDTSKETNLMLQQIVSQAEKRLNDKEQTASGAKAIEGSKILQQGEQTKGIHNLQI
jgi:hypothetical protein